MRKYILIAALFLAFGTSAFAQSCGSFQAVSGKCVRTVLFPWGTAGSGAQSVITQWVRIAASNDVQLVFSRIGTNAGTNYTGYLALQVSVNGGAPQLFVNGQNPSVSIVPHSGVQILVTQICYDPTCTAAPPPSVSAPNAFVATVTMIGNSANDLTAAPVPSLTVQFVQSGDITFQEQEQGIDITAGTQLTNFGTYPVNEGATPDSRYVYNGTAVTAPFTAFSVTNPSATQSITWFVQVFDLAGNVVANSANFTTPPLGANGYLLIGQNPTDPLAMFPSTTSWLAGPDGNFHGFYLIGTTTPTPIIYLSEEFWGNSMLNARFF